MRHSFHSARILRWMRKPLISIVSAGAMLFFYPMYAFSAPTDGLVVKGEANITQSGATTIIDQGSARAVIDWRSFNINANEVVRFNQLNQSSVALNRITGGDPTAILGQLSANGRVFLVNPNGIMFGQGSKIDVAGLMASTLSVNADDFMNGRNFFTQDISKANSYIVNQGEIRIADNGFCFLVAPGVRNEGTILAQLGKVVMASGNSLTLDFNGDGLMTYTVSGKILDNVIGPDGKPMRAAVENTGTLGAKGGEIVMVGNAGADAFSSVINNSGIVEATALSVKGSKVTLDGGSEGLVKNTGTIDVSAAEAGAKGGSVSVTGATILQDGTIQADAIDGDGGKIDIISKDLTTVGTLGLMTANAGLNGDGGKVMVLSDLSSGTTAYEGAIEVKGGIKSGDGGFVEVSGGVLDFRGRIDNSAAYGRYGTTLLDPTYQFINDVNSSGIAALTGDVIIWATGDITVSNNITSAASSLTFEANWDDGTSGDFTSTGYSISVPNGSLAIYGANIYTGGLSAAGAISLYTHTTAMSAGSVTLNGSVAAVGTFTVSDDGSGGSYYYPSVTLNSYISATSGSVTINASSLYGTVDLRSNGSNFTATLPSGTITFNSNVLSTNAALNHDVDFTYAAGAFAVNSFNAGTGDVALTAGGSITDYNGGSTTDITGATISLVTTGAGTVGTSSETLDLNATTKLNVTTAGGSAYINDTAGGITIGSINLTNSGTLVLKATGTAAGGSIIADGSANNITAGAATLTTSGVYGGAIGASGTPIKTTIEGLTASTNHGGIYITEADGLIINSVIARQSTNFGTDAGLDPTTNLSTGKVVLGGTATAGTYDVSIVSSTGNIVLNEVKAPSTATVTATTGTIVDNNDVPIYDATGVLTSIREVNNITAINANLSAKGDIGTISSYDSNGHPAGDAIEMLVETTTASTATATTGGNIYFSLGNAGTLSSLTAASGKDIAVKESQGNLTINSISASGGKVTLDDISNGSGALLDGNGASNNITASSLALFGKGGIGATDAIETTATIIKAIATDNAKGIGIVSTGALTSVYADVNDGTVSITDGDGLLTYASFTSGAATLNAHDIGSIDFRNTGAYAVKLATVDAGASGTVSITSAAYIADDGNDSSKLTASSATLAAGTSIGSSTAAYQLDTSVGTLTATAAAGGIYADNDKALSLTASANGSGTYNITLSSAGAMGLNGISATGAVTLTAYGSGSYYDITDNNDAGSTVNNITASSAVLNAARVGTSSDKIELAVTGLTATSHAGGVYASSTSSTALSVSAQGDVNIDVTGAMTLNSVAATGSGSAVTLTATGAMIKGSGATSIASDVATLSAASIGASASSDHIKTSLKTLTATSTGGGIYIDNTTPSGETTLNLVSATSTGSDADIVITSDAGLNLGSVTALGNDVTLTATGAITDRNDSSVNVKARSLTISGSSIASTLGISVDELSADGGSSDVILTNANPLAIPESAFQGSGTGTLTFNAPSITVLDIGDDVGLVTANRNVILHTTAGNIVFLDTNDTIQTQGTGTISVEAGNSTSGSRAVAVIGNLKTANRNISVAADSYISIGTLDAGTANVTVHSNHGIILDGNGDTVNIKAGTADIYADTPAANEADLRQQLAIAGYASATALMTADETLTQTWESSKIALAAAKVVCQQAVTSAQSAYNSAKSTKDNADDKAEALKKASLGLSITSQALDVTITVVGTVAAVAQAVPFTGDGGSATAAFAVQVAKNAVDIAKLILDESQLAPAEDDADEKANILDQKTSNLYAANKDLIDMTASSNAAANSYSQAKAAYDKAVIANSAAAKVQAQAIDANVFIGDTYSANGVGTPTDYLEIQVPGTVNIDARHSNVYMNATGNVTLGTLTASNNKIAGDNVILINSTGNITVAGTVSASDFIRLNAGGAILQGTSGYVSVPDFVATATTGIGSTGQVHTHVDNFAATGGTGGVSITNDKALLINSIDGVTGITATGGTSAITTTAGLLTVGDPVNASNGASSGNISLTGYDGVTFTAAGDVTTAGSGTVSVIATTGDITMDPKVSASDGSTIITADTGSVTLSAASNVLLNEVLASSGDVDINAGGSISDYKSYDENANITTSGILTMSAVTGIGVAGDGDIDTAVGTLAAKNTTSGGIFVQESNGLVIGSGTLGATAISGVSTIAGNGNIVIDVLAGGLTTGNPVSAHGTGNILLNAAGAIDLGSSVSSGSGHISVLAGTSLSQSASASDISTSGGTIDLEAATLISMVDGAMTQSSNGNIRYKATSGNLTVGELNAGTGKVALIASGNILDLATDTSNSALDITAGSLILTAGTAIGESTNHIETSVGNLTTLSSGSTFVTESNGVTVDAVSVTVNRVLTNGTVTGSTQSNSQEDLVSGSDLVLVATNGLITVNGGAVTASAGVSATNDILLKAVDTTEGSSTDADITLNASVTSTSGKISVLGGDNITQNANGDITASESGNTVDLVAAGSISMVDGALTQSSNGNILYQAGGNVTLGELDSGTGSVVLNAGGNILDAESNGGLDVTASNLVMTATGSIGYDGSTVNAIETSIANLTTKSTNGSTFVRESDDVTVTQVSGLSVNRVGIDGATTSTSISAQSDLVTASNGSIVLQTTDGSITLNDGDSNGIAISAHGSGNVLVQALHSDTDITANADIVSGTGNISVIAADAVTFNAGADILTTSTASTDGSIDVEATSGSITQSSTSLFKTTGSTGNIRLKAGTSVVVGDIESADGKVSVTAVSGGITDADALVSSANDADQDVTASSLRLNAGTSIGETVDHLETTVGTLSARAGNGSIYLLEANDVTVDDVGLSVNRVVSDATTYTTDTTDATQSDIRTTGGNGNIVLRTTAGSIELNDGSAADDDTAISANGSGNVLVQAIGDGTDITANADIQTLNTAGTAKGTGNISVIAADAVTFNAGADILTTSTAGTNGSIDVEATSGSITQNATSLFKTTGATGDIRLKAGTDVVIGDIESASGKVSVTAVSGSITDADALVSSANDADQDVTASSLRLNAGTSIGETVDHLETTVGTLTARAGNGSIYLLEANDVTVDNVGLSVNRVVSDATTYTTDTTDATQSDIRTTGGNGNIVLRTTAGSIELNDGSAADDDTAISANGSGNVLVQAIGDGTDITVNADIQTLNTAGTAKGTGNISVIAADAVTFNAGADILTTSTAGTNGSIDVEATSGSITQNATSLFKTTGATGDIRLKAGTDVVIGDIESASGKVSVTAVSGSITDADALVSSANDTDQDVTASSLRLNAGTSIGETVDHLETTVGTLTARAGNGSIYLLEANDVTVDDVGLSVNRVVSDATTYTTDTTDATQSDIRTTGGNGNIVLRTTAGSIELNDGSAADDDTAISANGSGNVLVQALHSDTDITANADIVSGTGNISVIAAGSVSFTGTSDILTTSAATSPAAPADYGSIDVESTSGSITQSATSLFKTTGSTGNIRLKAGTSVVVGDIESADGKVSITAVSGSITDADEVTTTNDTDQDVTSSSLRLNAGTSIGETVDHLETTVGTLSARAGNGSIYLLEANDVTVDDVGLSVNRVVSDATTYTTDTTDATQSDIRTTGGNGSIVLRTTNGSITLNNGTAPGTATDPTDDIAVSANGSGNILVQAIHSDTSITANADVVSSTGNITMLGAKDVTFGSGADITTGSTGTIDVEAGTGSITMSTTSNTTAGSGDLRMLAATDVNIGGLINTTGNVSLTATTGSILDNDSEDTSVDIEASGLRLFAGTGVGVLGGSVNPIETTVTTVSARATSGGINLLESDGVIVGDTSATVQKVGADAGVTSTTDATQSDLRTTDGNGSIVLRTTNGSITLNDGSVFADGTSGTDNAAISANGSGNVLVSAGGTGNDLTSNADVVSSTGHITLLAADAVEFTSGADILTNGTNSTGTIDVEAGTGSITMSTTSNTTAGSGDIRMLAATDVNVGGLIHTTGNVSLTATTGAILDNDSGSGVDIEANGLRLWAGTGVGVLGANVNPIETTVTTVSARATSGGINLLESDGVIVGDTSATVQKVGADAGVTSTTDATQSDLRTTDGNGSIMLRTTNGSITLNNGTAPGTATDPTDDIAVSANGSGNILVQAIHSGTSITSNADVVSSTGHITLLAADAVEFTSGADILTNGTNSTGTIDVESTSGSITMSTTSNQTAGSGDVRLKAGVDVTLGGTVTTTGNVSVIAGTGSIIDGDSDGGNDITASSLRLNAGTGIGSGTNPIETTVTTVSARATSGGINLLESDGVKVDEVEATVNRVTTDGTVTNSMVTDATQSDIRTTGGNGNIVLRTTAGSITLNDGSVLADGTTGTDNTAISANGSGNVTIDAAGTLTANAAVVSGSGNISIAGGTGVTTAATGDIQTSGSGTIAMTSTTGDMTLSGTVTNGTGSITLETGAGDMLIKDAVSSTSGNIEVTGHGHVTTTAAGDISTGGSGTIAMTSETGDMTLSGTVTNGTGSITLETGAGDMLIKDAVSSTSGNIEVTGHGHVTTTAAGDISTGGSGTIAMTSETGDMALSGTVTTSTGSISLSSGAGDIGINDAVSSTSGNITVTGLGNVTTAAAGDISTGVNGNGGNIATTSETGDMTLSGTTRTSGPGSITLTAAKTLSINDPVTSGTGKIVLNGHTINLDATVDTYPDGTITINTINDGNLLMSKPVTVHGDLSLAVTGDIVDNTGANDAAVTANHLTLQAEGSIGADSSHPFKIDAVLLDARTSGGDINITDISGGLSVGELTTGGTGAGTVNLNVLGGSLTESATTDVGADIIGKTVNLVTTGSGSTIGTFSEAVEIDADVLNITTDGSDINVHDIAGGVRIGLVTTRSTDSGVVRLMTTGGNMSEYLDDADVDVLGKTVYLTVVNSGQEEIGSPTNNMEVRVGPQTLIVDNPTGNTFIDLNGTADTYLNYQLPSGMVVNMENLPQLIVFGAQVVGGDKIDEFHQTQAELKNIQQSFQGMPVKRENIEQEPSINFEEMCRLTLNNNVIR